MEGLPARIYGPDEVDVAYEPWRAVGLARMRVGPSPTAPVVLARDEEVIVEPGLHFGRQSTRNPRCADHPALRAAVDGFAWGYVLPPGHRKSGWIPLDVLERDLGFLGLACGPARADFDRRDPTSCRGHCDGRPLFGVELVGGDAVVAAREAYLRYSPRGTAYRYLVRGDRVLRLCRWRSGNHDYTGIDVRAARWSQRSSRGWVITSALRAPPRRAAFARVPSVGGGPA
jgi:hypothetical protein